MPDERPAVWTPLGGCVLAAASLAAEKLLRDSGGRLLRDEVVGLDAARGTVDLRDAGRMAADIVVVAPGPGAVTLLPMLDVTVPLAPRLEQVVHLGSPDAPHRYDDVPASSRASSAPARASTRCPHLAAATRRAGARLDTRV